MKKRKKSSRDNNIFVLGIVTVLAVASIGAYYLTKNTFAQAAVSVYMAPAGKCSDTGAKATLGRTSTAPVCTTSKAQSVLADLKAEGKANGDVYVRLASGTYMTNTFGGVLKTTANKGKKFYVVPSWYSGPNTSVAGKTLPTIRCHAAGSYGLSVTKGSEGMAVVSLLNINTCTNGLNVGGDFSYACNRPGSGLDYVTGAVGSPQNNLTVHRVTIERIGNKYIKKTAAQKAADKAAGRSTADAGNYALNLNNANTVIITSSNFRYNENVAISNKNEPVLMHSIYAKQSSNVRIAGNAFNYVSGDPIRLRHVNKNVALRSNTFTRSGSTSIASDWHITKKLVQTGGAAYANSCLERPSQKPIFDRNNVGKTYLKKPVKLWSASAS